MVANWVFLLIDRRKGLDSFFLKKAIDDARQRSNETRRATSDQFGSSFDILKWPHSTFASTANTCRPKLLFWVVAPQKMAALKSSQVFDLNVPSLK